MVTNSQQFLNIGKFLCLLPFMESYVNYVLDY